MAPKTFSISSQLFYNPLHSVARHRDMIKAMDCHGSKLGLADVVYL